MVLISLTHALFRRRADWRRLQHVRRDVRRSARSLSLNLANDCSESQPAAAHAEVDRAVVWVLQRSCSFLFGVCCSTFPWLSCDFAHRMFCALVVEELPSLCFKFSHRATLSDQKCAQARSCDASGTSIAAHQFLSNAALEEQTMKKMRNTDAWKREAPKVARRRCRIAARGFAVGLRRSYASSFAS